MNPKGHCKNEGIPWSGDSRVLPGYVPHPGYTLDALLEAPRQQRLPSFQLQNVECPFVGAVCQRLEQKNRKLTGKESENPGGHVTYRS